MLHRAPLLGALLLAVSLLPAGTCLAQAETENDLPPRTWHDEFVPVDGSSLHSRHPGSINGIARQAERRQRARAGAGDSSLVPRGADHGGTELWLYGRSPDAPGATPVPQQRDPQWRELDQRQARARAGTGSINLLPTRPPRSQHTTRYGGSANAPGVTPRPALRESNVQGRQLQRDLARAGAGEINLLPSRLTRGDVPFRFDSRNPRRLAQSQVQRGILAPREYARWQDAYRFGIFAEDGQWQGRNWYMPAWYHYYPYWTTEQFYAPRPWYKFRYIPRYRQGVSYRYYRYQPTLFEMQRFWR